MHAKKKKKKSAPLWAAETRGSHFIIFDWNQMWQRSMRTWQAGSVGASFAVSTPLSTWAVCTLKKELTTVNLVSLISACHSGDVRIQHVNVPLCSLTQRLRFWISMGFEKGLPVVSFHIANYNKRRLCCSLNVTSQFDKCYLGNTTGVTFSSNIFQCAEVKPRLIFSVCICALFSSLSFTGKQPKMSRFFPHTSSP